MGGSSPDGREGSLPRPVKVTCFVFSLLDANGGGAQGGVV